MYGMIDLQEMVIKAADAILERIFCQLDDLEEKLIREGGTE